MRAAEAVNKFALSASRMSLSAPQTFRDARAPHITSASCSFPISSITRTVFCRTSRQAFSACRRSGSHRFPKHILRWAPTGHTQREDNMREAPESRCGLRAAWAGDGRDGASANSFADATTLPFRPAIRRDHRDVLLSPFALIRVIRGQVFLFFIRACLGVAR
jgi:hypothetical protein